MRRALFIAMDVTIKSVELYGRDPSCDRRSLLLLGLSCTSALVLRAHFAHIKLQHCPYHHEAESFEHLN